MSRAAVDTGGTFTDLVVQRTDGTLATHKAPTTPADFSQGVHDALAQSGTAARDVATLTHGTTVALNALLQGRGAKVGLLTTAGFRDVLEIMRASRPHLYDLQADQPAPLVPRRWRLEIDERTSADGEILAAVDPRQVLAAVEQLLAEGCECIAVAYLFSFRNPVNEERTREAIKEAHPDLLISISADITREWREFERTSTTVINSICQPIMHEYVERLQDRLTESGFDGAIQYMQSNGGLITSDDVRRQPVRTILSGPVGGVNGAELLGKLTDHQNLLTLDIGGTSADMCLIADGRATLGTDKQIERWPILFPAVDIHAVGAGGGSIAWIDRAGALQVGPHSAGADPGPACYGRGGELPTVTDAHVVLGTIDPDYFLGGQLSIDADAAARAIDEHVATPLGLGVDECAAGIIEVINVKMVGALREVSIKRGHDPRDFALLAFGGAGGLHAAALAREIGVERTIVPANPGVFSAMGMLAGGLKYDFSQMVRSSLRVLDAAALASCYEALERTAHERLDDAAAGPERRVMRSADLRYSGQEFTISIPLDDGAITSEVLERLAERFEARHQEYFGFTMDDEIFLVNARASVESTRSTLALPRLEIGRSDAVVRKATRSVLLSRSVGRVETPIYDRELLRPGQVVIGPGVIEEAQSTIVIGDGDSAEVDEYGNLLIDAKGVRA